MTSPKQQAFSDRFERVNKAVYDHFLITHPRAEHLRLSTHPVGDGEMWYTYDNTAWRDNTTNKPWPAQHAVAYYNTYPKPEYWILK